MGDISLSKSENMIKFNEKYFKKVDSGNYLIFFGIVSIAIWTTIVIFIFRNISNLNSKSSDYFLKLPSHIFIWMILPYLLFLYQIWSIKRDMDHNASIFTPDFTGCLGLDTADGKSLGKVDFKCKKVQYLFLSDAAQIIQNKGYYLVYTLFTIVLLFFSFSSQNRVIRKNDVTLRVLIKVSAMVSLLLLTAPLFMQFYWKTLGFIHLYENLTIINITTICLLLTYILYNLYMKTNIATIKKPKIV